MAAKAVNAQWYPEETLQFSKTIMMLKQLSDYVCATKELICKIENILW